MPCLLKITSAGEGVERREPLCTVGGNVNGAAAIETMRRVFKKLKIELSYHPAIPLHSSSGGLSEENENTNLKRFMVIVALFEKIHGHCSII